MAFNIAAALTAGRKPSPCFMVENDVDVRITDVPLNLRRPDITVYRCTVDRKAVYADAGILST